MSLKPNLPISQTIATKPLLVIIWQSLVVQSYRSFFYELAKHSDYEIVLIAPQEFRELGSQLVPCAPFDDIENCKGYSLPTSTLHTQAVWYRGLWKLLLRLSRNRSKRQITIVAMSEPYSLTTLGCWLQVRLALMGKSFTFGCFALQNIFKQFSTPINLVQKAVFRIVDFILVLGAEHQSVLRQHGFKGKCLDFPLWFDSSKFFFSQQSAEAKSIVADRRLNLGFIGSLVPEKGVLDLLNCLEANIDNISGPVCVKVAGSGILRAEVQAQTQRLASRGIDAEFLGPIMASNVPSFFRDLDILIVPSKTAPHWKEQFGRVIAEAMACGCTVIGSSSGEIPVVIGNPNRVYPEGRCQDLIAVLNRELNSIRTHGNAIFKKNAELAERYSDRTTARAFLKELKENRPQRNLIC